MPANLDIVKVSQTGAGNSADYLTARLKRDHDGTKLGLDIVKTSQTGAGNSADYRLCKEDRELHGLLVKHRPSKGQGHRTDKANIVNNVNEVPKRAMGNTRAYIEQRLQAEFPSIWKQYISGEFKSARAAGQAQADRWQRWPAKEGRKTRCE